MRAGTCTHLTGAACDVAQTSCVGPVDFFIFARVLSSRFHASQPYVNREQIDVWYTRIFSVNFMPELKTECNWPILVIAKLILLYLHVVLVATVGQNIKHTQTFNNILTSVNLTYECVTHPILRMNDTHIDDSNDPPTHTHTQ